MSVPPIHLVPDGFAVAMEAGLASTPWRAGDMVRGEVVGTEGAVTVLRVDGVAVAANAAVSPAIPPRFEALVVSGGPRPVLEIIADGVNGQSPYAEVLHARLVQQDGIQPLLADLQAVAAFSGLGTLSEPLRIALSRLEGSVASRDDLLDPDLIHDALQRSGVQLEHLLANLDGAASGVAKTAVEYDFKGALERLIAVLPQPADAGDLPPAALPALTDLPLQAQPRAAALTPNADLAVVLAGMATHARAAHARIELMQADAASTHPPFACMGEIPVRGRDGFDVLQVRVQPKDANEEALPAELREWVLEFTFAPPELGTVQGQITLCDVHAAVDLWAERDRTLVALEEEADALLELLRVSGVSGPEVRVHHGLPARHTGFERRIVDTTI